MPPPLDFRAIFDASPNAYMLLDRELRYVDANPAYLRATATPRREDLIGRKVFELFPNDPDDSSNASARLLRASFERVLATGQPDVLAVIPYRIAVTGPDGATYFEEHAWSATHAPIFAPDGTVAYVLQHTTRVTELLPAGTPATRAQGELAPAAQLGADVLDRARIVQARNVTLDDELSQLRRVFEQAPGFVCYLRGPEHVFALANAAYYQVVGHRDILGRAVREALPELAGQGFFELLDRVFQSGKPFVGRALAIDLEREVGAPLVRAFVDFVYQPIVDARGRVTGIFVQGQDITLQKHYEEERERLGAIVEQSSDFMGVADAALKLVFVNEAGRRLVGLDEASVTARRLTDFLAPEDPAFVAAVLQPALARGGR